MKFDIDDPEVRFDIRRRSIAMAKRRIGELVDKDGFQKFVALSGIGVAFFLALPFSLLGIKLGFQMTIIHGLILGYIVYIALIVCVLMAFKYSADNMLSKLAEKYTIERCEFIRSQFLSIGFKTSEDIYPAEFVDGHKCVVIQKYRSAWDDIHDLFKSSRNSSVPKKSKPRWKEIYKLINSGGKYDVIQKCKMAYKYKLDGNYGKITISYIPVKSDIELNKRNILGIRDFDMMFNVEWSDEVKARTYLSSTKILELMKIINLMDNFVDKRICIDGDVVSFAYDYQGVSELSTIYFPDIDFIINETKSYISRTNEYFNEYDKFAYIIKK